MDFDAKKLLEMAKSAASLGIEMFVLDDGWFGARSNDRCALGDWVVNEKKLGCTLHDLVEQIKALGLSFGLWFEPEMISPDSDLYRALRTGRCARAAARPPWAATSSYWT